MDATFRVRYRATETNSGVPALLVEDRGGTVYLFSGGQLQLRFDRAAWSRRVGALLERGHFRWLPVESDAQLPLEALNAFAASQQFPPALNSQSVNG